MIFKGSKPHLSYGCILHEKAFLLGYLGEIAARQAIHRLYISMMNNKST
jgi:hypothetical protein